MSRIIIIILIGFGFIGSRFLQDPYVGLREKMVHDQIERRGVRHIETIKAMKTVPRHLFVPEQMQAYAYEDRPLAIGNNQTISQPYIVAFMTASINPDSTFSVLEIGTGSGYQAAILSDIVKEVFTIEIIPELSIQAQTRFDELGYDNIYTKIGDGYGGWPDQAPFDAIVVTAAPPEVPQPLINQLKEGVSLIIPVGPKYQVQSLQLITKKNGKIKTQNLFPVRFVPFTREEGP